MPDNVQPQDPPGKSPAPKTIDQWRESLPADLAGHASLAKFNGKGFDEVVKSYLNLESKLGSSPIVRPKDDAPAEEWSGFYEALGRPKSAEEYALQGLGADETPDGFRVPENLEKQFKSAAHDAGLTIRQANALWKHHLAQMAGGYKGTLEAYNTRLATDHDGLKKDWGAAYESKMQEANRAALAIGGQDLVKWLKQSGAGREVPLIKAFAQVARFVKEDSLGEGTRSSGVLTPSEAQSLINGVLADTGHAYHHKDKPGHKQAVEQMSRWYAQAYPEDKEQ
jgi:hypothetical protein